MIVIQLTDDELSEAAQIVNRIGADHGFEFDEAEYFVNRDGATWFEVKIKPSGHCVAVREDGRSVPDMAAELAGALAIWADRQAKR